MKKANIVFWSIYAGIALLLTITMGVIGAILWLICAVIIFKTFKWIGKKFGKVFGL